MTNSIHIGGRRVGPGAPVYLVAEIGANHGQRLDEALRLLGTAKRAGVDAVKVSAPLPEDWPAELAELAGDLELDLFAGPGAKGKDLIDGFDSPVFEIPVADPERIRRLAATGKPLILSTSDADPATIEKALAAGAGAPGLALLWRHDACPAPVEELRLRTISRLSETFGVPVGFGDHTLGTAAAVAAVALGAAIVEKHLTLSRALPIDESAMSLEPDELARLVAAVRTAEDALGEPLDAGSGD